MCGHDNRRQPHDRDSLTHSLTHGQAQRDAKHCAVRTFARSVGSQTEQHRLISEAFTSFVCSVRSVRYGMSSTSSVAPSSQAVNAQDEVFMILHVLSVECTNPVFYMRRGDHSMDRKLETATNVSSTNMRCSSACTLVGCFQHWRILVSCGWHPSWASQ